VCEPVSGDKDAHAGYAGATGHHETPIARYHGDVVGLDGLSVGGLIVPEYEGQVLCEFLVGEHEVEIVGRDGPQRMRHLCSFIDELAALLVV
jgi:hypothetical protein